LAASARLPAKSPCRSGHLPTPQACISGGGTVCYARCGRIGVLPRPQAWSPPVKRVFDGRMLWRRGPRRGARNFAKPGGMLPSYTNQGAPSEHHGTQRMPHPSNSPQIARDGPCICLQLPAPAAPALLAVLRTPHTSSSQPAATRVAARAAAARPPARCSPLPVAAAAARHGHDRARRRAPAGGGCCALGGRLLLAVVVDGQQLELGGGQS